MNSKTARKAAIEVYELDENFAVKDKVTSVLEAAENDFAGLKNAVAFKNNIHFLEVGELITEQFREWRTELVAARQGAGLAEAQEIQELILELEAWIRNYS